MNQLRIRSRLLDPMGAFLSPEVAQRIAALRADEETQVRLGQLAVKSTEAQTL